MKSNPIPFEIVSALIVAAWNTGHRGNGQDRQGPFPDRDQVNRQPCQEDINDQPRPAERHRRRAGLEDWPAGQDNA